MRVVLEYGEEHSEVVGVEPPSPNSSSGTLSAQEAIRQAHRDFQTARLVHPGDPIRNPPSSPVVAAVDVVDNDDAAAGVASDSEVADDGAADDKEVTGDGVGVDESVINAAKSTSSDASDTLPVIPPDIAVFNIS